MGVVLSPLCGSDGTGDLSCSLGFEVLEELFASPSAVGRGEKDKIGKTAGRSRPPVPGGTGYRGSD